MERLWIYLINPILVATLDSYRAMKKIGDYTFAALIPHQHEPFFRDLYNSLLPLNTDFNNNYAAWIGQQGSQKGETSTLNALFSELRGSKIKAWDRGISDVYPEGSGEYTGYFPRHRRPFQQGTQEDRLSSLQVLSTKAAADAALPAALVADISGFYNNLSAKYLAQKGAKSDTRTSSDDVEAARVAYCTGMYGILGLLMDHFKDDPSKVAPYFDLETIRNREQSVFRNSVAADGRRLVMTHTFAGGDEIKLINDGPAALQFFLGGDAEEAAPESPVIVEPNSFRIISAASLGPLTGRFLIALNGDHTNTGHYTVVLI